MSNLPLLALSFVAACAPSIVDSPDRDSDRPPSMVLEGDALADELRMSPVHETEQAFLRLGVSWDAEAPTSIEIATSVDADRWTTWEVPTVIGHEVEGAASSAFVGVIEVSEPSRYYRIRGGNATFVGLDVLAGDDVEDATTDAAADETDAAVGINARSAWGARAAKCSSAHTPNKFTIHHTVTPTTDTISPQARLRNIQAYHQDVRGWCDIGYNFLVSRDGRLWEGRGAAKVGSHVAGQNTGNIGISFIGTYTATPATSTQTASAASLISQLAKRYGIAKTTTAIKGHRDRGQTSCPGDRLYAQIAGIVTASKSATIVAPPPPSPTTVKGVIYRGTDPSSRIANATVRLGDRTTTSSATGYYEFPDVIGTAFVVTADAAGFAMASVERAPAGVETWASISLVQP